MATMMVESDIKNAPIAGEIVILINESIPAASGNEITLYASAQIRFSSILR